MKIIVENKIVEREGRKGVFVNSESGRIKTGYLIYDENEKNIGIVFKTDDIPNKSSYGQSQILFDEDFEKEFNRTWYIIKSNKNYLPYDKLKKIMSENRYYEIDIDF